MNLKEIKQLTDNFKSLYKWKGFIKNSSLEELKLIKPTTISKLPKEFQYYLVKEKFRKIHGNRYDYSKFTLNWFIDNYQNNKQKVPIICPQHGLFYQRIDRHLRGQNCSKCIGNKKLSYQDFIRKAIQIHNGRYQYPFNENWWNKNYKNRHTKAPIICPIHSLFYQRVGDHLNNHGCPKCGKKSSTDNQKLSYKGFIDKATKIHNSYYQYPFDNNWWRENYKGKDNTKVPIICPIHGLFYQSVNNHLNNHGCPVCKSSKGELKIKSILDDLDVNYIYQYRVKINDSNYYFDFYLPDYNIFIEYDGEQHFKPIKGWGGRVGFEKVKQRDKIKNDFAKNNQIKLVRIPYYKTDEEVEHTIKNLIKMKGDRAMRIKKRRLWNPEGDSFKNDIIGANTTGLATHNFGKYANKKWYQDLRTKMRKDIWFPEDIEFYEDARQYPNLLPEVQRGYNGILSFLVFLDSIQTINPFQFASYITAPDVTSLLVFQAFQEDIHSQAYSTCIETVIPTPEEKKQIYDFWRTHELLKERNGYIAQIYQDFADNPTDRTFARAIIGDYILEGLYFYNGFKFFYILAEKGLMRSTADMIYLINRDEVSHLILYRNLIKEIRAIYPDFFDEEMVIEEMRKGVELEEQFSKDILAPIVGFSDAIIEKYTRFLANKRLREIGISNNPYSSYTENPYKRYDDRFEAEDSSSMKVRDTNPFTNTVTDYSFERSTGNKKAVDVDDLFD